MNETQNNPTPGGDLAAQVAALQRQVFTLLMALIVVSGTLTVYLYWQNHVTRKDLTAIRPLAEQTISTFNRDRPAMELFLKQLVAYGQAHPDFQPVLKKYGAALTPAKPATTPPAAPKK
jgi:hypothetical protein